MEYSNDFVKFIRTQRHDFMNHFQIIYAYIQMGKAEEAKEYINGLSKKNQIISSLYNLGDGVLALYLEKNIERLWKQGVIVLLDIEIDYLRLANFKCDYYKKCTLVNNIFNDIENNNFKFVYIYIFQDDMGENLFISNKEELVDEISWMEEWEKLPTGIQNVQLYKCNYEGNLAYRMVYS